VKERREEDRGHRGRPCVAAFKMSFRRYVARVTKRTREKGGVLGFSLKENLRKAYVPISIFQVGGGEKERGGTSKKLACPACLVKRFSLAIDKRWVRSGEEQRRILKQGGRDGGGEI